MVSRQVLLEAGADPGQADLTGSLPLHTAVLVHNMEILEQLAQNKLILNKTDLTGMKPKHDTLVFLP